MAELVDAQDLKSCATASGFESRHGYFLWFSHLFLLAVKCIIDTICICFDTLTLFGEDYGQAKRRYKFTNSKSAA